MKLLSRSPSWLVGGCIGFGMNVVFFGILTHGFTLVSWDLWHSMHAVVAFLFGALVGSYKKWKNASFPMQGALFGCAFALAGSYFLALLIDKFGEGVAYLFAPVALSVVLVMGDVVSDLKTASYITIGIGITAAFYALVGAGIGAIIRNFKKS